MLRAARPDHLWVVAVASKERRNPPLIFGLLRMRCQRPCGYGADSGDEFSTLHCLTQATRQGIVAGPTGRRYAGPSK